MTVCIFLFQSFQQNNHVGDEYTHKFAITVDNRMMEVKSKILRAPLVSARSSQTVCHTGLACVECAIGQFPFLVDKDVLRLSCSV